MTLKRLDHIGIVVDDLVTATAFFVELGLTPPGGSGTVEGEWVDRIVGLDGVQAEIAMLDTPDGRSRLELVQFHAPQGENDGGDAPSNALGLRHLAFAVDDLDETLGRLRGHGAELVGEIGQYGDVYRLCYIRGPAGIIVELAQRLG